MKLIYVLILLFVFPMYAMENVACYHSLPVVCLSELQKQYAANEEYLSKTDPSIPCDDVCHLNKLPIAVLCRIVHFLRETQEEFIKRTESDQRSFCLGKMIGKFLVRCPDKIKEMEIIQVEDEHDIRYIKQQDLEIHDKKDTYKIQISSLDYKCIALSRGGNLIAFHYHKPATVRTPGECFPFLVVQKINLQKNEQGKGIIELGGNRGYRLDFEPTWIGFNKQGTCLIARRDTRFKEENKYKFFTLKDKEEEVGLGISNKLQKYLRDKFVCNNSIEGQK
jgi:hypothetical protein